MRLHEADFVTELTELKCTTTISGIKCMQMDLLLILHSLEQYVTDCVLLLVIFV